MNINFKNNVQRALQGEMQYKLYLYRYLDDNNLKLSPDTIRYLSPTILGQEDSNPHALIFKSLIHSKGIGTIKNPIAARKYLELSILKEDRFGLNKQGQCYQYGLWGTEKNLAQAKIYFEKAIFQGETSALIGLSSIYSQENNFIKAHELLNQAINQQGMTHAKFELANLLLKHHDKVEANKSTTFLAAAKLYREVSYLTNIKQNFKKTCHNKLKTIFETFPEELQIAYEFYASFPLAIPAVLTYQPAFNGLFEVDDLLSGSEKQRLKSQRPIPPSFRDEFSAHTQIIRRATTINPHTDKVENIMEECSGLPITNHTSQYLVQKIRFQCLEHAVYTYASQASITPYLQAFALMIKAKSDSISLELSDTEKPDALGSYHLAKQNIFILTDCHKNPGHTSTCSHDDIVGVLTHETMHAIFDNIYNTVSFPFKLDDVTSRQKVVNATHQLLINLHDLYLVDKKIDKEIYHIAQSLIRNTVPFIPLAEQNFLDKILRSFGLSYTGLPLMYLSDNYHLLNQQFLEGNRILYNLAIAELYARIPQVIIIESQHNPMPQQLHQALNVVYEDYKYRILPDINAFIENHPQKNLLLASIHQVNMSTNSYLWDPNFSQRSRNISFNYQCTGTIHHYPQSFAFNISLLQIISVYLFSKSLIRNFSYFNGQLLGLGLMGIAFGINTNEITHNNAIGCLMLGIGALSFALYREHNTLDEIKNFFSYPQHWSLTFGVLLTQFMNKFDDAKLLLSLFAMLCATYYMSNKFFPIQISRPDQASMLPKALHQFLCQAATLGISYTCVEVVFTLAKNILQTEIDYMDANERSTNYLVLETLKQGDVMAHADIMQGPLKYAPYTAAAVAGGIGFFITKKCMPEHHSPLPMEQQDTSNRPK